MTHPIIIHGSENSLDIDAYLLVEKELSNQDAKKICEQYSQINANLLLIENGQVKWCYKGTRDECNNSILATYHLHKQVHPCPIEQEMPRAYGLKLARTLRGLLSYVSRTEHRTDVKKALTSSSLDFKLEVLNKINLTQIEDFEKSSKVETYKFFAFQIGQTLALLKDNRQLFTKNTVAQEYPDLKDYLDRKESDAVKLQKFYTEFLNFVSLSLKKVDQQELYVFNFHGKKEVIDFKKESTLAPVVIFDIDGTLMDESHRAHLREAKDWEKYFDACDLDSPITHAIDLLKSYKEKGYEVWLMSGRGEACLEKTKQSMQEHGVPYDHIKLRSKNVFIPDYVLKPAWVAKYIGLERVEAVYDDQARVLEGFAKKGLNAIDINAIATKKSLKV